VPVDPEDFAYLRGLVAERTGVAIEADAAYLVELRLHELAHRHGFAGAGALLARLARTPASELHRQAVLAMLTHETSFFRDPGLFEAIRTHVLPGAPASGLRVLSAACASGQEIYSLAMLLYEHDPALAERSRLHAGDVSAEMVAQAQAGRYSQMEVNRGLPARLLARYFEREAGQWRVAERLRRMIHFELMNVLSALPFASGSFDLVLLRNLLIYFALPTRRVALAEAQRVLAPGGLLVLGSAEFPRDLDPELEPVPLGRLVCYRRRRG
jgi:chemotaxis protein methyltransferase CheR